VYFPGLIAIMRGDEPPEAPELRTGMDDDDE
jgi:hypothetical protein